MFDIVNRLFNEDALSPHGICLLWRPELIWTHAIADAVIGLAYFSIPIVLGVFAVRRRDFMFGWMFWCFAIFILACGTTHFFSIWTLWFPDYGIEALIKAVTAVASLATAIMLWPLLPKALALPSPAMLRQANRDLARRVGERDEALLALQMESAERRRTEDLLRQAQKMEAIGQLTGGLAHDFNNLLTVIVANLERLERLLPSAEAKVQRSIAGAWAATNRASDLVRHLLAFSRRQPLRPETVDIGEVVREMTPLMAVTLGSQVATRLELPPRPVLAVIDRNQLEHALLNIAVNARHAMPDGGSLVIRARQKSVTGHPEIPDGPYVSLELVDTGEGMAPDVVAHAFEPFFTTKPVGKGSGLGLSHVYGFARQSGGLAEIDSIQGQGTTVRLLLPQITTAHSDAVEAS